MDIFVGVKDQVKWEERIYKSRKHTRSLYKTDKSVGLGIYPLQCLGFD